MPYFSIRKIILHNFHVDKNKGESGIGYKMIIGHNLMVHKDLIDNFRHKFLQ